MPPWAYALASKLLHSSLPERLTADRVRVKLGALVAALTLSLHPLRVESVAWVTERRGVLAGLFFLLAIWAYLRYCEARTAEGGGGQWPYWTAVVLCGLALMSKVMAVSLPVILLLLDIYPLPRLGRGPRGWSGSSVRAVLLEKHPFVALCAGASALALWAQLAGGSPVPLKALPWSGRLAIVCYQLAFYLGKTLVPTNLAMLYELRVSSLGGSS